MKVIADLCPVLISLSPVLYLFYCLQVENITVWRSCPFYKCHALVSVKLILACSISSIKIKVKIICAELNTLFRVMYNIVKLCFHFLLMFGTGSWRMKSCMSWPLYPRKKGHRYSQAGGCVGLRFRLDTVLKRTLPTLAENQISFLWSAADSLFTISSELPSSHMNTVTTGLFCSANW